MDSLLFWKKARTGMGSYLLSVQRIYMIKSHIRTHWTQCSYGYQIFFPCKSWIIIFFCFYFLFMQTILPYQMEEQKWPKIIFIIYFSSLPPQVSPQCWLWLLWVPLPGSPYLRFLMWLRWISLFLFVSFLFLQLWWSMAPCIILPATKKLRLLEKKSQKSRPRYVKKKNYLYKQQLTVGDTLLSSLVIFS